MYSLIEHDSLIDQIIMKKIGSLWFYSKDEAANLNADIANDNNFAYFK